jgi:hypothetical protein
MSAGENFQWRANERPRMRRRPGNGGSPDAGRVSLGARTAKEQRLPGGNPGPTATGSAAPAQSTANAAPTQDGQAAGKPGHIFVINPENKSYYKTWSKDSAAPYLFQPGHGTVAGH